MVPLFYIENSILKHLFPLEERYHQFSDLIRSITWHCSSVICMASLSAFRYLEVYYCCVFNGLTKFHSYKNGIDDGSLKNMIDVIQTKFLSRHAWYFHRCLWKTYTFLEMEDKDSNDMTYMMITHQRFTNPDILKFSTCVRDGLESGEEFSHIITSFIPISHLAITVTTPFDVHVQPQPRNRFEGSPHQLILSVLFNCIGFFMIFFKTV